MKMAHKIKLRYRSKCSMKKKETQLEKSICSKLDHHVSGIPQNSPLIRRCPVDLESETCQAGLTLENSLPRSSLCQRSLSQASSSISESARKFPAVACSGSPLPEMTLQNSKGLWGDGLFLGPGSMSMFGLQGAHCELSCTCQGFNPQPSWEGTDFCPLPPRNQTAAGNAAPGAARKYPPTTTLGQKTEGKILRYL